MNKPQVVVVGNGIAGTTAAFTLRENGFSGDIIILSDEQNHVYYRTRLPELISGQIELSKLTVAEEAKFREKSIEVRLNNKVVEVNALKKTLQISTGETISYSKLVLATGASPFFPPIPGCDLKGVFGLRQADDAYAIKKWADGKKSALCLGGGLLGLEVAFHLTKLNLSVHVIEGADRLLPRQLDRRAAEILRNTLESKGFKFILGAKVKKICGEASIDGIELENLGKVPGEICVVSAGVTPRTELAKKLGLKTGRGIIVDDGGRTGDSEIFAAGDAMEFKGRVYGTWLAARHWGKEIGEIICGKKISISAPPEVFRLKVSGVDILSVGNCDLEGTGAKTGDCQIHILKEDAVKGIYHKIVVEKGIVSGAILLGVTEKARAIETAVKEKTPWEKLSKELK